MKNSYIWLLVILGFTLLACGSDEQVGGEKAAADAKAAAAAEKAGELATDWIESEKKDGEREKTKMYSRSSSGNRSRCGRFFARTVHVSGLPAQTVTAAGHDVTAILQIQAAGTNLDVLGFLSGGRQ
mgnify:CR=1 FL=1